MNKQDILNEIRRTAAANGGTPLGVRQFASTTGIREPDWKGKLWARWSDAVREAGYAPNELTQAHSENHLLEEYAKLALDIGQLPTSVDLRLCNTNGRSLPDWSTYTRQFGGKPQLVATLREYCQSRDEFASVVAMCDEYAPRKRETRIDQSTSKQDGFVYLMKSAKFYKIGKANSTHRRHRELAIQMPERLVLVHEIRTDDPFGIEAYWHNRFADKRQNGEWFALSAVDVAAFKRRKFM